MMGNEEEKEKMAKNKSRKDEAAKEIQPEEETKAEQETETVDAACEEGENITLSKKEFDEVKAHIETLAKQKDEAVGLAQRLQADFDNYRKRNATLRADSYDDGCRDCIKELLPVLDNFERALDNSGGVEESFVEGMRLIQRTLIDSLGKSGLKEVDASKEFDPNLHNAVMQEACEGKKSGEIIDVLQKGYEAKGRILRHTMVKVAE